MKSSQNAAEFLLVDFRPQEDLMFWDTFSRGLANVKKEGRWICVLVGSGEKEERVLAQKGLSTLRSLSDELEYDHFIAGEVEKTVRQEKNIISSRLTDEGVSAVGIMGFERGLIRSNNGQILAKEGVQKSLWQAPAVVPILMSVCLDETGLLKDVHPIRTVRAITLNLPFPASITIVSQRVRVATDLNKSGISSHEMEEMLCNIGLAELAKTDDNLPKWKIIGPALQNNY